MSQILGGNGLSGPPSPQPTSVFFRARGSANAPLTVNSGEFNTLIAPFNTVVENVGSAYNGTSFLFTAPVDGVYQFMANLAINSSTGTNPNALVGFFKNTATPANPADDTNIWAVVDFGVVSSSATGITNNATSWTVRLDAGDTVGCFLGGVMGSGAGSITYTFMTTASYVEFSGTLISEQT